jgi:hypothetical protein
MRNSVPPPPRRIPLWVAVILLTIAALGAYRVASAIKPRTDELPPSDSGLVIAAARLDFGHAWEDRHFLWVLPIENRRSHDIEIVEFSSSCTCSMLEPRSLNIPAGQSREVRLTLDLTAQRSKLPDAEWRDFEVRLWPRVQRASLNAPAKGWAIRGRVHTAIRFEQPVLDLGRHSELSQPLTPQTIVVTSYVPLRDLTVISSSPDFQVQTQRSADEQSQFELMISPKAHLPVGAVQFQITAVPQTSAGQQLPGKSLPVTGLILSDLQASPPAALFGARPIGEVAQETVTLHSLTGQRFTVTDMAVDADDLAIERVLTEKTVEPAFILKQRVTKQGHQAGRAVIRVETTKGSTAEISVPVSYLGIAPPE